MPITPIKLRNYEFNKKFRGFDPLEVESLVDEVATEMEKLLDTIDKLKQETKNLSERLKTYQNIEQSLKDSLLTAEKAADETRAAAAIKAKASLEEAEAKCEQIKEKHLRDVENLKHELATLKMQKVNFTVELKSLVESHLKLIDERDKQISAEQEHEEEKETDQVEMGS